ncbi:MAG: FAD-dependent oxidoreductase [Gammaproteobacteria bacterium]|nr:FAD-dependent oxidoreductase [Gammaproteobacteria bacterium]
MNKIAVIGAGPMGLAVAYELGKQGQPVDLYEYDDRLGGMSAHFDFNGLSIERYYHFVCHHDDPLFALLDELGIRDKLHWADTKMGYYYEGHLHRWGDPFSLLGFPHLDMLSKLRYGMHMFLSSKRKKANWRGLDALDAVSWLKQGCGERAYAVLWERLFKLKFHEFTDNLSAAWIWARIRRVGRSRRSIFQESMGYLEGGSQTLLNALASRIQTSGGQIHLSTPVQEVIINDGRVDGIKVNGEQRDYARVISTIPLQYVPKMIPALPEQQLAQYAQVQNIGVICLLFKLRQPVTDNFWLNISDRNIEIPGIIEMSNLQPFEHSIVYVPYYMPQTHPKFAWSDEQIIGEATDYLKCINPVLTDADIIDVHASRYAFAQPICQPQFADYLPPMRSSVSGLFIADTSYYYPEDRSISESVALGKQLADMARV